MPQNPSETHQQDRGTSALRRRNRESIVALVSKHSPITRGRIAEETGLTGAAVSRITRELITAGLVSEGDPIAAPKRVGRREYNLTLNPQGAYVVGISITANRRSVSLANASGEVLGATDCNDIKIDDPEDFLTHLSSRARKLVTNCKIDQNRLLGVGVSAAISLGRADKKPDSLITSEPLGWKDVPVRDVLEREIGLPVIVEHRASAILHGELRNLAPNEDVYLINAALGLGSSARFGGRFLSAFDSGIGPLSHFAVASSDVLCHCGRRGCLEVIASGRAVLDKTGLLSSAQTQNAQNLSEIIQRANEGDTLARAAFHEAGKNMAFGVDAILALMRPDKVILAGEVGRQDDFLSGISEGLKTLYEGQTIDQVHRSSITSEEAAISVALDGFLHSGNFDLDSLMAA